MGFGKWAFAGAALMLAGAAGATPADDTAIGTVEAAQTAAWNAHDAHGFAALFAPDADLVSVRGVQWQGRDVIEQKIGLAFASIYAKSSLRIDGVAVRSLSPDLALATVNWSMTGLGPANDMSVAGIQTQLLKKSDAQWLILSFHNTVTTPDQPLPMAATAQPAKKAEPEKPKRRCIVANAKGECIIGG